MQTEQQEHQHEQQEEEQQQIDPLNIEHWYSLLEPFTFPSQFLTLYFDEAQALSMRQQDPNGSYKKYKPELHDSIISNLEQRIDNCLLSLDCNSVFVRLSTRSPKDASLKNTEKVEQILRERIQQMSQEFELNNYSVVERENLETLCLVHSFHQALKVQSGQEALNLILQSKRSYHDIFVRLLQQQTEKEFNMIIAIRKWIEIQPGMEFRAFVYNNRITVCSQYFQACYIKDIKLRKEEWITKITDLFEQVKPLLTHIGNYVIDFAVLPDGQMKVVELNHFEKTTGSALFDWKTEEDLIRGTNLKENDPYLFRIIEEPVPNSSGALYAPLRSILEKVKQEQQSTESVTKCILQ
jgi:hypothetical protein